MPSIKIPKDLYEAYEAHCDRHSRCPRRAVHDLIRIYLAQDSKVLVGRTSGSYSASPFEEAYQCLLDQLDDPYAQDEEEADTTT